MNIGSLYKIKKYFWFLFPTKETALNGYPDPLGGPTALEIIRSEVAWYSKRFNCEVTYFSPDSIVVFLEEDGELKRVLTSEGLIGWTWFNKIYNYCFEEVKAKS